MPLIPGRTRAGALSTRLITLTVWLTGSTAAEMRDTSASSLSPVSSTSKPKALPRGIQLNQQEGTTICNSSAPSLTTWIRGALASGVSLGRTMGSTTRPAKGALI